MHFTADRHLDDGVRERHFTLDGIPGLLWTPADPAPLVLLGHPGDLGAMYPRLAARARHSAAAGFATATLELPGAGIRPRDSAAEAARADLRRAILAGDPVDAVVDRLVPPLVEQAVPEWRAALDALLPLPGLGGPVGLSGGILALGLRLALTDPRIAATVLFAGTRFPRAMLTEARALTTPVLVLLQWDDDAGDRHRVLDLFDALGSPEKTLHANTGGHTGIPAHEADAVTHFFHRHLRA